MVPKSKLKGATLEQWNSLVETRFEKLNAASVGAGTSKPRMASTNMVSVQGIKREPSADPNIFLEAGETEGRTMPCVVTCPRATWDPLRMVDKLTHEGRFCSTDKLTRLMGYQLGPLEAGTSDRG